MRVAGVDGRRDRLRPLAAVDARAGAQGEDLDHRLAGHVALLEPEAAAAHGALVPLERVERAAQRAHVAARPGWRRWDRRPRLVPLRTGGAAGSAKAPFYLSTAGSAWMAALRGGAAPREEPHRGPCRLVLCRQSARRAARAVQMRCRQRCTSRRVRTKMGARDAAPAG